MDKVKKPLKSFYDVRVEIMAPVIITYRVLADDPEDAIIEAKKQKPRDIKPKTSANIINKKPIITTVHKAGCSSIELTKKTP